MRNYLCKSYIEKALFERPNQEAVEQIAASAYFVDIGKRPQNAYGPVSSQEAAEILGGSSVGLKQKAIAFAFHHKEFFKKLPIVGRYLLQKKEAMLHAAMTGTKTIDISPLLGLDDDTFIGELYQVLLNRLPDEGGLLSYAAHRNQWISHEAMAYILVNSPEFAHRYTVLHLEDYRKSYQRYIRKCRLNKIPVLNRILPIFCLRGQFSLLYQQIDRSNGTIKALWAQNQQMLEALQAMECKQALYQDLQEESAEKLLKRAEKLAAASEEIIREIENQRKVPEQIIERLSLDAQLITSLHEKIDQLAIAQASSLESLAQFNDFRNKLSFTVEPIPERIFSCGIINSESYLEKATQGITVDDIAEFNDKDKFYYLLANFSRGTKEFIQAGIAHYMPFIQAAYDSCQNKPVLDIGCGRGEFLEMLSQQEIAGVGVDLNTASTQEPIRQGYDIQIMDAEEYLASAKDKAFSCITMFQVAEHIPFEEMFDICKLIAEKLDNTGLFVMETINPYCFYKFGSYKIDPSHIEFPSPDAFKLLLEMLGFQEVKLQFYAPLGDGVKTMNPLSNYEGYCILAKK